MTLISYQLVQRFHLPSFMYTSKMGWNKFAGSLESWFQPRSWFPLFHFLFSPCADVGIVSTYNKPNWTASTFSGRYVSLRWAVTAGVILCDQVALRNTSHHGELGQPFQSDWNLFTFCSLSSCDFWLSNSQEILCFAYTLQMTMAIADSLDWLPGPPPGWKQRCGNDPGSSLWLSQASPHGEWHSPSLISGSWFLRFISKFRHCR